MKKIVVICLLLSFVGLSNAQNDEDLKKISFSGNVLGVGNYLAKSFNVKIEFIIEETWSFHYEFAIGRANDGYSYYHCPATIQSGFKQMGLSTNGESSIGFMGGFLMLFLPEGISYNLRLNDKFELSPFLDINSCEYFGMPPTDSLINKLSGDLGLSCHLTFKPHLFVAAYASMTMLESTGLGVSCGIGVGLKLFKAHNNHIDNLPSPAF